MIDGSGKAQEKNVVVLVAALRPPMVVKLKEIIEAVMNRNASLIETVVSQRVECQHGVVSIPKLTKECRAPLREPEHRLISMHDKKWPRGVVAARGDQRR